MLHSPEAIELYSDARLWSRTCGWFCLKTRSGFIVRLCNEFRMPVWSFSRGHNWGYGTMLAPRRRSIVILEKMNRILK
jgi:4-cresol dehydrogenase (hydroxylating)